ncbi:hypothetical protein GCM10022394_12020 [Zobellella aerophila]|uniref:Uncharacterized protein n=1 Tax=Zobellella aerophila TaxID=870480 RepID=A0ABP6VJD1_9GAMM
MRTEVSSIQGVRLAAIWKLSRDNGMRQGIGLPPVWSRAAGDRKGLVAAAGVLPGFGIGSMLM